MHQDGAYLVPLRIFVGLGWLRAFAEKLADPNWRDGSTLTGFLNEQVAADAVPFGAYVWLIEHAFLPGAAGLALVVLLGQLLTGLGITFGALTNAALLGGLFMNLNFLLAGAPNPSAFYVVIQVVLLLANAGAVLGADARLAAIIHSPFLSARPPGDSGRRGDHRRPALLATLSLAMAAFALLHVRDWSPGGSVEDAAMVLAILGGLGAAWSGIAVLRAGRDRPPTFAGTDGGARETAPPLRRLPGSNWLAETGQLRPDETSGASKRRATVRASTTELDATTVSLGDEHAHLGDSDKYAVDDGRDRHSCATGTVSREFRSTYQHH